MYIYTYSLWHSFRQIYALSSLCIPWSMHSIAQQYGSSLSMILTCGMHYRLSTLFQIIILDQQLALVDNIDYIDKVWRIEYRIYLEYQQQQMYDHYIIPEHIPEGSGLEKLVKSPKKI